MIEIKLGDRYAKSIIELAAEKGQLEAVRKDFKLILDVIRENRDFRAMLKSPVVNPTVKQKILTKVFAGKLSPITDLFVQIIVRKHREMYLLDIAERFVHQYELRNNITRGVLTSAIPLSDAQRKTILEKVEKQMGTTFLLEEKVNPELIGGFVLRVGDVLFDGSIATELKDLKSEFVNNPYVKLV